MADQMRPTPRNSVLGLFSDIVNLPLQYMSSPERTQQMQGTAQFLYGTGIPKTLERMSYGDSLFSGSGMTLRPKEETINAAMNVAPFAPAAGRLASRTVRATEGLPVGMSIKDVGKSAITREGNPIQSAVVLVGDKIFMGRTHGDALNRAVYEGVVRKEGGKYIFPKGAEVNSDLFMTKDGQIIDRLQASKMFDIGASETAIEKGLMQNNPPKSMTVDSYIEEATALKKQREQSPYPQQAALDLAQQRAALPVEQGGLGLPANNTAADRAKAMGINTDAYHGSKQDITGMFKAGYDDNLAFVTQSPEFASKWIGKGKLQSRIGAEDEIKAAEDLYRQIRYKHTDNDLLSKLQGEEFNAAYDKMSANARAEQQKEFGLRGSPSGIHDTIYPVKVEANKTFNPETDMDVMTDFFKQNDIPPKLQELYAGGNYMMYETKPVVNYLKSKGYDSVRLRESTGDNYPTIAVFNPETVRSRFAAFDPFRKDVATATAMGVALPDLLAQPVNQYQPIYETIPMYTDPFGNTIGSSIR